MKLKIALKTTRKHTKRVEDCLSTWLGNLDYICVTDNISGLFNEISCGTKEDYESAEEKTCNFFMKMKEGFLSDYDWVLMIDDDAILNYPKLFSLLGGLDKNMVYGYDMTRAWLKDLSLCYPSGGAGYLVSPSLVSLLSPMEIKGIGIEDVRVGLWMRENGLKLNSSLPLWPYFPRISTSYWDFIKIEKESPSKIPSMINDLSDADKSFVKSKITHHYIRGINIMMGFHELMTTD